MIKNFDKMKN